MELGCLPGRSQSIKREVCVEVQEDFNVIRLPYESTKTVKGYEKYVQKLFNYLSLLPRQHLKPVILDLVPGARNNPYWSILLDHLSLNIMVLDKIDCIDLSAGTFTLKHLQDCHSLFKKSQKMNIRFPEIYIDESQAALQLTRKEVTQKRPELSSYSVEDLNRLTEKEISNLLEGQEELLEDISKQQFLP